MTIEELARRLNECAKQAPEKDAILEGILDGIDVTIRVLEERLADVTAAK